MAHFSIEQTKIRVLKLPSEFDLKKIQIGVPITSDEASKINLKNIGDIVLPSGNFGVECERNAYGYTYPDKSRPQERRYVSTNWIHPFGNENASSVAVDIYKKCYSQVKVPPTEIEFILYEGGEANKYVIANLTPQIINNFLKETVNLFLEIYGYCYIFSDEITIDEATNRRRCNWEMLPPGEKPSAHLINHLKKQGIATDIFDVERLRILDKYKTEQVVGGINGFNGYYAYIFKKYCVLESAIYGNATYIIPKENWEILSQKTKQELIDENVVVEKIIHTKKWNNTIRQILSSLENQ